MKSLTLIYKQDKRNYAFFSTILLFVAMNFFTPFKANAQSFALDLQYNPMSFTNDERTVLNDPGNNGGESEGAIHRYDNVAIVDGVTLYAHLEILEINNAFIQDFDDDTQTGSTDRFQPRIGSNSGGGFIVYQLSFFDTSDDQPVFIYNYYMTGVDIDGNGSNKEYVEVGGYSSYLIDNSSQLVVSSNNATGRTKFLGRSTSLSGVTFDNTAAFIANFSNPNNKISFALGQSARNNVRYYSVQFGAEGGEFDTPLETNNPQPVAIDDQGTPVFSDVGGTSVSNILDNDLFDGSYIDPAEVNISVVDPASVSTVQLNTTTGEVTVLPGTPVGTYQIVYRICLVSDPSSCDIATITVPVEENTVIENNYPATGYGTLAFEDLWPGKGDYDFNDLVIDFKFNINTDQNNMVNNVDATFIIQAFGAGMENGFGFQLSEDIDPADVTVSGYSIKENYISLEANGIESGQSRPTIIVFDNAYKQMPHPGNGIGVNTEENAPYVTPDTIQISMTFPTNQYSYNDLDISNFNPFLIVDQTRGIEVHLPDYKPTDLADPQYLGSMDDDSEPGSDRYYKTSNNLPWAIKIYEAFDYPIEKIEIIDAHLKFDEWATSGGTEFEDWYQDNQGYRNQGNIYEKP
ncbi:MAG TPA: LruC domain-containing protein [Bacteroidales bacterium]|nr:LruC domain-containing protein [Bacteroidales bacterium]